MIEVKNLTKLYGNKRAVNDLSFTINSGEVVGFLGPNGAGKSTTMNIITGYLSSTSGSVSVCGIDVLDDPMAAKRHIGYLPEIPPVYPDMTVAEYLDFVYELKGVKGTSKKKHLGEICEIVGISHVRDRVIKNLSKGYRQRTGLAMALVGNPDVLILDEPTVGLDPIQIIEIRNVIKELGRQRTVVLSTHILSEVEAICERVLVINNGSIVANDSPENLSADVSGEHKFVVRVAGPQDAVQAIIRASEGIRMAEFLGEHEKNSCDFVVESDPAVDVRKPLFYSLAKAGYPILMLKPMDMSLEDIFVKLTHSETVKKGAK
ncbi:MAG: ATP-binding cassette domain-containing protein [Clostridia bacterium]|nr:ATP-binding cassette domain-containing protein [Oscillospiraceae bacterium]MBR6748061.1 ATP-binding cassette domain-containing protein [Clostridia bacterium]MBR7147159.1 ATP-binding cassette domain-containing protein [Oscillospiraceae bacterium]